MLTRQLGTSGVDVSALAVGTTAMAGDAANGGFFDENEAIAALHVALDAGVNLIDTAPAYGRGRAETLVGRAIRGRRDSVLVATKCGLVPANGNGELRRCLTRESVMRECEASLRRLQSDWIDLYQCQGPDPNTPIRETMEALTALQREGKIRLIGLCQFSCQQIGAAIEFGPVHAVQTPYSLLNRRAGLDLIPYCQEIGIGVLAHSPLALGLLTGTYKADSRITGVRARDPSFLPPRFAANLAFVDALEAIARRYDRTPGQLALQWVLSRPGVAAVIAGAMRPTLVSENVVAVGGSIESADERRIEELLRDL